MRVLVLNGGSSSLKCVLRDLPDGSLPEDAPAPVWEASVDWGHHPGKARVRISGRPESESPIQTPADVLRPVLATLPDGAPNVVGHRVVHGGKAFRESTRITPEVRDEIRKYCEFAPEHNRLELEAIETSESIFGAQMPQIAVFDTAFHATLPLEAQVYPGPYEWFEKGIRRYGFHGISHQYASERAARILGRKTRLVSCHLGNGASLAAIRDGVSIDTTMGFTPLDGIMMGTRPGSLDPGILVYLVRHLNFGPAELDRVLNKESGLRGVSGVSGDMRDILTGMESGNDRARLAFDVYIHRLCREIGAMVASLGGVETLLFTAGIGENCPPLRAQVCERLAFLGIELDAAKNSHPDSDTDIATTGSRVRILVIHADEDWQVARECHRLLRKSAN